MPDDYSIKATPSLTDSIAALRAQWDQTEARITELERQGVDVADSRFSLQRSRELIDFAARLNPRQ